MKTIKTITINGQTFALPEGMASKDVQSLAGFLCTLTQLGQELNYSTMEYLSYVKEGVSIQVSEAHVVDKAEAKKISNETREQYTKNREAEEAVKTKATAKA